MLKVGVLARRSSRSRSAASAAESLFWRVLPTGWARLPLLLLTPCPIAKGSSSGGRSFWGRVWREAGCLPDYVLNYLPVSRFLRERIIVFEVDGDLSQGISSGRNWLFGASKYFCNMFKMRVLWQNNGCHWRIRDLFTRKR